MKITVQKVIGASTLNFEVDEAKPMDALCEAGFLAQTPDTCKCGSKNIVFTSNKAKGFTFIKVICQDCQARAEMGQYKEGGFFWKRFQDWVPNGNEHDEDPR